mgnify:CR=1 FL=1
MNTKLRLIVMNFLQYGVWGAWLISLGGYLGRTLSFSNGDIGSFFATMGIASLFMPAIMGVIADRWVPAQRLLGVSHIVAATCGIAALVLCVVFSAIHHNPYAVVSSAIYGSTSIILYTMSTLYHSFKVNNAKRVFRIIDHCSIFLLIAGSYTPMALCTIRAVDTATGWWIFGIVWAMAFLGIALNSIDLKTTKKSKLQ